VTISPEQIAIERRIDLPTKNAEIPACAAINVNGLIVAGHRHCDCLRSIHEAGIAKGDYPQGFMTTAGRFVESF
jgi:hypothetical protein